MFRLDLGHIFTPEEAEAQIYNLSLPFSERC